MRSLSTDRECAISSLVQHNPVLVAMVVYFLLQLPEPAMTEAGCDREIITEDATFLKQGGQARVVLCNDRA